MMSPILKKLSRIYLLSFIWTILVLYLCFVRKVPYQDKFPEIFGLDKIVHMALYAIWYVAICHESRHSNRLSTMQKWITIGVLIVVGGLIEIFQQNFFPPRTADFWDFVADIVGVVLGVVLYNQYLKRKR
jgi:VanZ family protein